METAPGGSFRSPPIVPTPSKRHGELTVEFGRGPTSRDAEGHPESAGGK